jgi:hypothetical protein
MAGNYEDLGQVVPIIPAVRSTTSPGYRIMQRAATDRIALPRDMARFVAIFHEIMSPLFTWNPAQGGNNGRAVLDGTRTSGECQYLAAALHVLLISPTPYGFGIAADTVRVVTYNTDNGFIAHHVGMHYGLAAKVIDPTNESRLELYRWGDHKVVEYDNRFWDVCYDSVYDALDDMAYYSFTAAVLVFNNRNMLFTATRGVATSYFIMNDRFLDKVWADTIGPYDAQPAAPTAPDPTPPKVVRRNSGCCIVM